MLRFSDFEILTFDCYGTLIDWETGIFSSLKPILSAHDKSLADAELLELYGELEAEAEAGPYRSYREILRSVVRGFGKRLSFTPTVEEMDALSNSIPKWRPWPDTVEALKTLAQRYRLAIISNIDDELFQLTSRHLPLKFDPITTAQQAKCYKPGPEIFRLSLTKIRTAPERILHVGQSIYHDVLPAQSLGIATVWVNRPSLRAGVGAVKRAEGKPDLEVPDLKTLAKSAGC